MSRASPTSAQYVNNLFVITDMEFSSAPVTVQPSGPIHPPLLIPTQSPSSGPGPELYGSGFVLQDDPATSNSLDSIPGGREGKAHREEPGPIAAVDCTHTGSYLVDTMADFNLASFDFPCRSYVAIFMLPFFSFLSSFMLNDSLLLSF